MSYHGRDLRNGRISEVGQFYLITAVTYDRVELFREWDSARLVIAELRAVPDVETNAWVLMPDHLHWLFRLCSSDLSAVVQCFKSRSAIALNRARNGSGPIWQKGLHDHALRRDENVRTVARYIIANPLRAGLVTEIGQYPYWDAVWLNHEL